MAESDKEAVNELANESVIEESVDGKSVVHLGKMAAEILRKATEKGVEHGYMFVTSFKRYMELIEHMNELQKCIKEEGMMVAKEYVKGRKNLYINPAVAAYNATCACANREASLIMKCIVEPITDKGGDGDGDDFDNF